MKVRVGQLLLIAVTLVSLCLTGCQAALARAESRPAAGPVSAQPLLAEQDAPADWQTYVDEVHGFRIAYPADWQYKAQEMGGPGMPDDWPIVSTLVFFPNELAQLINREGPPDPNAPPAIPPFSLDVFVGPMDQFRRAYIEPGVAEEAIEINGASMVVERDGKEDYSSVRYVFAHPTDPEVRVVLVDVISGFSQRAADNPEYLEIITGVVASLEFIGEAP